MAGKPFRSKILREAAKERPCVCCADYSTTVGAHIQPKGQGSMGSKIDDFMLAHLCHKCHAYCDTDGRGDADFKLIMLYRTLRRLFADGILRVA